MIEYKLSEIIDSLFSNAIIVVLAFLYFLGIVILVVTIPLWILPYLVYKKIRYGHF